MLASQHLVGGRTAWVDAIGSSTLLRYGTACLAPAAVSGMQFVLQAAILRKADMNAFGLLSFILGFVQFGYGLSNALVIGPYTLVVNDPSAEPDTVFMLFKAILLLSGLWALGCCLADLAFGDAHGVVAFAVFGFLSMMRWFGRSHLYANHHPFQAALSDVVYALVLAVLFLVGLSIGLSVPTAMWMMSIASLAALAVVGGPFLKGLLLSLKRGVLKNYSSVWKEQSRWMLLGVVASEATSNAHSYGVTFFLGSAALAPISAAALLLKPIALLNASLTQLERPIITRKLFRGETQSALHSRNMFRVTVLLSWGGTTLACFALLWLHPHLLLRHSYDLQFVMTAFALWSLIALMQCWSQPTSVLMQAVPRFGPLARIGAVSAAVAIVLVGIAVTLKQPLWTLVGLALAQLVMNVLIGRLERLWRRDALAVTRPLATEGFAS